MTHMLESSTPASLGYFMPAEWEPHSDPWLAWPHKHETWNKSRHGHAYETLKRVNKAFDPECLECHVTGFDHAGGFVSEVDTPELKNVQCEVCHGPMLKHSENPQAGFGSNARQSCKYCHVKNHSPNFNFSKYWPKIKH